MAISDILKGNTGNQGTGHTTAGGAVGKVMNALSGGTHRIDHDREDAYWCDNCKNESYFQKGRSYEDYAPAYRTGYSGYTKHPQGTRFEDAEATLQQDYAAHNSSMPWSEARPAAQAAWSRVERGESFSVPLSEEELKVGKREVEAGAVHVRKVVHTETVNQPVELRREEAVVERVAASGQVPADAFQEGEIRVPLKKEEAVVQKTAHVTGEVHIKKGSQTDTQNVQETLRKEDVVVDKEGAARIERDRDIRK